MYREKTPQNFAFIFMDFTDFACFGHGLDSFLKGPVSRESDKTCQTVGHFYRPWVRIAESESDREIRRTLEKYETNKKHETNNFSKNFFLHIFSADREKNIPRFGGDRSDP